MRIKSLRLRNIRQAGTSFPELRFSDEKNVTILLGDNGSGKSTVLDSIALLMAPFRNDVCRIRELTRADLHVDREGRPGDYLEVSGEIVIEGCGTVEAGIAMDGYAPAPASRMEALEKAASALAGCTGDGGVMRPIYADYAADRGHHFPSLSLALSPRGAEAVRRAVRVFVGGERREPLVGREPPRLMLAEEGVCMERELGFDQMSHGCRIMIAMAADIAARMAEANPAASDPLLTPGVIVVDEVDLHLHPKWQRRVVGQLREAFPAVQFILTTHSPVIVAGASDDCEVVSLDGKGGCVMSGGSLPSGIGIAEILLSDLFGLETLHAPKWDAKVRRRDELLALSAPDEASRRELASLNGALGSLRSVSTPAEIAVRRLLGEVAAALGIEGEGEI